MSRLAITKILAAIFILLVTVASIAGIYFYQWWQQPLDAMSEGFVYEVESGSSLSRVVYDLNAKGLLDYPRVFLSLAKLQGKEKIHKGEYQVEPTDSPLSLLEKLRRGDVVTYQITLVEGWTVKEILARLQAQEKIKTTLTDEHSFDNFIQGLGIENDLYPDLDLNNYQKLEGWLFPDTYRYSAGVKDVEILKQAYTRMKDVLATEWEGRSYDLPYDNVYQALVMASIVERETGEPTERQQIAGVFVRRLQKHMRLQTDPTVIYGLGDSYQGNIRRKHLSQSTPYNTYVIFGLPPTPIASPGRDAIYAALHPDEGNALYFVAKGDGSHYFSDTLEQHNQAVQRFQVRQRANNYKSSPSQSTSASKQSSGQSSGQSSKQISKQSTK